MQGAAKPEQIVAPKAKSEAKKRMGRGNCFIIPKSGFGGSGPRGGFWKND